MDVSRRKEQRGFILCWAASKHAEWKTAIVERLEAICPGEPVIDDGSRFEPQSLWRKALVDALPMARAILLVIEPRALLRAQVQPPGYDCVDELVPREIHRLLADRRAPIVPLLVRGAEWPDSDDLPPELRPLLMRRAVTVPIVKGASDFSAIDARVRELVAMAPPVVVSRGAPPPVRLSASTNTGGAARPFVRNRWRVLWLQHRILVCLAVVLLIAGIVGAGVLALQQLTPAVPASPPFPYLITCGSMTRPFALSNSRTPRITETVPTVRDSCRDWRKPCRKNGTSQS